MTADTEDLDAAELDFGSCSGSPAETDFATPSVVHYGDSAQLASSSSQVGPKTLRFSPLAEQNEGFDDSEASSSSQHQQQHGETSKNPADSKSRLLPRRSISEPVFEGTGSEAETTASGSSCDLSDRLTVTSSLGSTSTSTSEINSTAEAGSATTTSLCASSSSDSLVVPLPRTSSACFRAKMLSRLNAEGILIDRAKRTPSSQCVVILDWDDTLCCTSYFAALRLRKKSLSKKDAGALQVLQAQVRKIIQLATEMGSVYVITNAMEGWVEYSCQKWLPDVVPLLAKLPILSARAWEKEFDVSIWKTMAFREISKKMDARPITNLVAIGDSIFEINAAHDMARHFPHSLVKTVKLDQRPTPSNLVNQLQLVLKNLQSIVLSGHNMEVSFMRTSSSSKTRAPPEDNGSRSANEKIP
eukprot:CAMPEP_0178992026 /NCGR_PEP_ID=MMETSP0795-20121207/5871_1 /TAXON_ID=88552 /ORGANISM="Amoebophrya sp., Strain Ameob2" /LENGTH=414 /DNA_ID=CAMNT_0020683833 /DNA_START=377 /DNA_END=1624 /DNA_ORIENTATION=-